MENRSSKWKEFLHEITFESRTRAGKAFDIVLLFLILSSIIIVMLDSVPSLHIQHKDLFHKIEWIFTILFTLEYILRIISSAHRFKFIFSVLGIIDFIAIIPNYLTLFYNGPELLLMLRVLRLLRIFRIFRLSHFLNDLNFLSITLYRSLRKISIFIVFALVLVLMLGSVMYLVEKPEHGFTSIPQCIYWALVTITTVGYGDVVPITPMGKILAGIVMLTGYAIIAVPMGIVTTEMVLAMRSREAGHEICKSCGKKGHDADAAYCKYCGEKFEIVQPTTIISNSY